VGGAALTRAPRPRCLPAFADLFYFGLGYGVLFFLVNGPILFGARASRAAAAAHAP
jgi:hypothetical protein